MRHPVILAGGAALAAAALLVLTACAPHPAPSATAHSASTGRPSPTASAAPTPPPLADDVLIEISVTATAPNGAVARLTETVHAPVTATDQQSGDESQLDNECDSWRSAFSSTRFVVGQVSAVLVSGSWDSKQVIAADMAGYPVWQGDQRPFQGFCANALISIPGSARAVSPVGGGDADTDGGWAIYRYGFGVPTDPGGGDGPSTSDVVLSHCSIRVGAAAHDSVFASSWPTSAQTDKGLSCYFGGS